MAILPYSLSAYHPYLQAIKENLPENIIEIELSISSAYDRLNFIVYVKNQGIYSYPIDRCALESSRPSEIASLIKGYLNNHIPKEVPPTEDGAEQYEEAMMAQDIIDELSP